MATRPPGTPNILLITLDQFRGDALSCAGHPVVATPNLDRLAGRGVRFANHWSNTAPCGPSRASLLCGRYLHNHRSVGNGTPLDRRFDNLATITRDAGYDPLLFGYTDTTLDPRGREPDDPALRTYESVLPGFRAVVDLPEHLEPWGEWLRARGYEVGEDVEASMYRQRTDLDTSGRGATWAPTIYAAEHTESAFLTDELVATLDATGPGWCIHASYLRPHPPYAVPAPYHDMYDPADVPPPVRRSTVDEEAALHPMLAAALGLGIVAAPSSELDGRQLIATYYGMIAEVDAQLGRLLDAVWTRPDADHTIIVLTSDHGEQLGDHWLVQKLGFFDESYHIPLMIAGPGVTAPGSVVSEITENVDVLPTLLDMAGIPAPDGLDGRNLVPFLTGADVDDWRDAVHWEWDFRHATPGGDRRANLAVHRTDSEKYVHFAGFEPLYFDLSADPYCFENLAADPGRREHVLAAAQALLSWRMSSDDETLTGYRATPDGMEHRRRVY